MGDFSNDFTDVGRGKARRAWQKPERAWNPGFPSLGSSCVRILSQGPLLESAVFPCSLPRDVWLPGTHTPAVGVGVPCEPGSLALGSSCPACVILDFKVISCLRLSTSERELVQGLPAGVGV